MSLSVSKRLDDIWGNNGEYDPAGSIVADANTPLAARHSLNHDASSCEMRATHEQTPRVTSTVACFSLVDVVLMVRIATTCIVYRYRVVSS